MCHNPSSLLCSDCTNLSSPHGGDVSLSGSLFADEEAGMNCSEESDFCTGTESLFFNFMQQRGEGSSVSACLSVFFNVYLFSFLIMLAFPKLLLCVSGN